MTRKKVYLCGYACRQAWQWVLVAMLLTMSGTAGRAGDLSIQSFDGTGKLSFNEVSTAKTYRVEWAPTPGGPWTNFTAAALAMDEIVAKGSGIVTCSVPMCYRVVASVTNAPPPVPPSGMVLIPGGTNAGTDPDFEAYSLTVSSFYMDATEVTKAQWDEGYTWAVTNGYSFDNTGSGKATDHPAQTVNWYDCVKWCNARSEKDGRTPCYTVGGTVYKSGQSAPDCNFAVNGYRLPTLTEWEYAARGGLSGKRFPWGDTIDHTRANYRSYWKNDAPYYAYDDGYEGHDTRYATGGYPYTSPVGVFAANGYGLYDMTGNVKEWCNDVPISGPYRTYRGGGCYDYANHARCGDSDKQLPSYAVGSLGFRAICR